MDKSYKKRFCECEDWKATVDAGGDYERKKLRDLLSHYPGECPYCHQSLKIRLRKIDVYVEIEPEFERHNLFSDGVPISLRDLKELLEEI